MGKQKQDETTSTEVVAQVSSEVAVAGTDLAEWGDSGISSKDLVISKILAMQPMSDLVTSEKAKFGDFVDSVSGQVLGSIEKPLDFLPFKMEKAWIVSRRKQGAQKFEFEKYCPYVEGEELPFEATDGNDAIKNEYVLQFYVLLLSDTSMPYVISFKSSSVRAGKVLATQMYARNKAAGKSPAGLVMELGGKKEQNDQGRFVVMETKAKRDATRDEENLALGWFKTLQKGKHKVAAEKAEGSYAGNAQF